MIVTVIGLGLIGGSFAKSLSELSADYTILGCDLSAENEEKAMALGLVSECLPMEQAISKAEIILLAIPVDALESMLSGILDRVRPDQLVIDFGSTKLNIAQSVISHPKRANYLAAHPMAGTENTGPEAALSGLYENKILILCDHELTNKDLLEQANSIFDLLSFQVIFMDSESHDKHIAYVSHLSHVSSFMLGLTVLDIEKDEENVFNMAGSGFMSTVRLAMSSPDMWTPIFLQNKKNVKNALSQYIERLQLFEKALDGDNFNDLHRMMTSANQIKKALGRKEQ